MTEPIQPEIFSSVSKVLSSLQPLVSKIVEATNLSELATAVFEVLKKDFVFNSTGFYFINQQTKQLELILAEGLTEQDKIEAEKSAMERHPGWVIKNKRTYLSDQDVSEDLDFQKRLNLVSRLYSPILYKGECVGTIGVASDHASAFNSDHVAFMEFVCKVSAVAYENIIHLQELNISRERMNQAIRALHFGIWDWDFEKNILIWDDFMYELFEVDKGSFSGAYEAFEKTLHPDDSDRVRKELSDTFARKGDYKGEFRILTADGRVKRIAASGHCIYSSDGKIQRLVGANWDITTEREKEIQMLQISKMSSLGEMSAGIAHEINNPLAIIMGKSQQIKIALKSGSPNLEILQKHAESIESTTQRIARIVKGLRVFSREGSMDPFEPRALKGIIEDTTSFCFNRFKDDDVVLDIGSFPDTLTLECQATQISQVLLNLLNNAFDAVHGLEEKWVKIEVEDAVDSIRIRIIDSGNGIPPETARRMLEPFFTTKEIGKGTGLGLSISHGIIKSHQGTLAFDPIWPTTCFVIELPKKHQPQPDLKYAAH